MRISHLCLSAVLLAVFAISCKTTTENSDVHEAWNDDNAPEKFGVKSLKYAALKSPNFSGGSLKTLPWTDDYWPLNYKNMAKRYSETKEFESFEEQIDDAKALLTSNNGTHVLSPSVKYDFITGDERYGLTKESWDTFNSYNSSYDDLSEWSWMVICHGWAPAAYRERAPRHAVMAQKDGKQVLFFEGDIRGLLSKAWATNSTKGGTAFMGSRCNESFSSVIKDDNGRPVDGAFTEDERPFYTIDNKWDTKGFMKVSDSAKKTNPYWIHKSSKYASSGTWTAFVYKKRLTYFRDWISGNIGKNADSKRKLKLYRQCRDMNPGAFQLVLAAKISKNAYQKGSFVADMVRDMEVWNHPIYAFRSEIGPLKPVSEDSNLFRAEGTTHIASVITNVAYISEEGPFIVSEKPTITEVNWNDVSGFGLSEETMEYTLEFDKRGYVIGGEWKEGTPSPDFIWDPVGPLTDSFYSRAQGQMVPSYIKASVVKKLNRCSQQESGTREIEIIRYGVPKKIKYTDCPL